MIVAVEIAHKLDGLIGCALQIDVFAQLDPLAGLYR